MVYLHVKVTQTAHMECGVLSPSSFPASPAAFLHVRSTPGLQMCMNWSLSHEHVYSHTPVCSAATDTVCSVLGALVLLRNGISSVVLHNAAGSRVGG
jgi:hypothetical protein